MSEPTLAATPPGELATSAPASPPPSPTASTAPTSSPPPPVTAPVIPQKKGRRPSPLVVVLVLAAAVGMLLVFGGRGHRATANNEPIVSVAKLEREDLTEDLWLSAEFHPYQEVSLHSKVTGYLKSIAVDYGDHVKAGQKIAELEVPELEDELAKARSAYQASLQDVKKAEADFSQADIVYQRLLGVSKEHPKLVAQQELDDARTKHDAMNGALGAARQRVAESQSEIDRTKTLFDYTTITAPFEGIITRRYVDPGALIQAGTASSSSQSAPIVDLAQQSLLRLVFPVPESATPTIRDGAPVEIAVTALNEKFQGTISRFAGKVDRSTRTMHTEVDVPNPDDRYTPGMYAFVRIILKEAKHTLAVPIQALAGGDRPSVFIINKDGVIEERTVTVGLQTPDKVEIKEGLAEGDLVIVGRRNGARPGQKAVGKIAEPAKTTDSTPAAL
jgi:RND family efflux transporter MFP subunit